MNVISPGSRNYNTRPTAWQIRRSQSVSRKEIVYEGFKSTLQTKLSLFSYQYSLLGPTRQRFRCERAL